MVEAKFQKLTEEIKREFLDKNTVVIEHDDCDYIDKPGDYRQVFISLMH